LQYVIDKYGTDFIKLYEHNKNTTFANISTTFTVKTCNNNKKIKQITYKERVKYHSRITKDELQSRINKILQLDIDLTKLGWVTQVVELTGLTRRQINYVINHSDLKDKVYYRQSNIHL